MEMEMEKINIKKFNGINNFTLWSIKMRVLVFHQGLKEALEGESKLPTNLIEHEKKSIVNKACSVITLSLGDKDLHQVSREMIVDALWLKLESLQDKDPGK